MDLRGILNSDGIWIIIPVGALVIGMIKALSKHQLQMAALIHGNQNQVSNQELDSLKEEVGQLRAQVNSLTLALDSVSKSLPQAGTLERRLDDTTR